MFNYLAISLPFVLVSCFFLSKIWQINPKTLITVMVLIFALTALFDSLIIWAGIYDYDVTKMLGVIIIKAPIEDFLYSVFAVATTIYVWERQK